MTHCLANYRGQLQRQFTETVNCIDLVTFAVHSGVLVLEDLRGRVFLFIHLEHVSYSSVPVTFKNKGVDKL